MDYECAPFLSEVIAIVCLGGNINGNDSRIRGDDVMVVNIEDLVTITFGMDVKFNNAVITQYLPFNLCK